MAKNERKIKFGKTLLESGELTSFMGLETAITINFMRKALGNKDYRPLKGKIFNPRKFTVGDFVDLAKSIDCDPVLLFELAIRQLESEEKKSSDNP